ncbi:MAG TPA: T9SS type A sorting domain-containing protein, partial [Ignavibacteria bacterium]|nr:T9SS type A sorting domain-containing protein [Ignavibacteria bacterium]
MKNLNLKIIFLLVFTSLVNQAYSQSCTDCFCGTQSSATSIGFDTLFGGRFKPSRSDIGGSPSNEDYFPVLIVFVQFSDEPYSYSSNPEAWNSGQPPNYINRMIDTVRRQTSNSWWDSYNGFAISDYWHEFSHGKLHIIGRAESIILSNSTSWYQSNGGGPKVNKDVYDILKQRLGSDWKKYDNWKYDDEGKFTWAKDSIVDMVYLVFRQHKNFAMGGSYLGIATLGGTQNDTNNLFTVYRDATDWVKIFGKGIWDIGEEGIGSGLRAYADSTSIYSKQTVLDLLTHEHGHYLFQFGHRIYGKMSYGTYSAVGNRGGWEFSLSPWESIKLNYLIPEIVSFNKTNYTLGDYSKRYYTTGDTGGVLQVPISQDGEEFFLITNRGKVSDWDRRMGGDTLATKRWQFLKDVNQVYGKGVYIYHNKNGYKFPVGEFNDIDMECADGLWEWVSAGVSRKRIDDGSFQTVYKKSIPRYDNDDPQYSTTGKDDMSKEIVFTEGSPDIFNPDPNIRGTHSIFTNDEDYWFSLASIGDRWDAWNVGYNEVFSPHSSPSTNKWNNDVSGIYIWLYSNSGSGPTSSAAFKIYKAGEGGYTDSSILQITPPSRPMGLIVLPCDSQPSINGYKRIKLKWNHNTEPDMERTLSGEEGLFKRYKIYRSSAIDMSYVPDDAMAYSENYYDLIATVDINKNADAAYTDEELISICNTEICAPPNYCIEYPVRYRVQAVDKYDDVSVLSDFVNTRGGSLEAGSGNRNASNETGESETELPLEYSLSQNYPNPFNPETNIRYDLPFGSLVTLKIYDILGKEVYTLINEYREAGRYITGFSGADLSSGIYYYTIRAGGFTQTKRM